MNFLINLIVKVIYIFLNFYKKFNLFNPKFFKNYYLVPTYA